MQWNYEHVTAMPPVIVLNAHILSHALLILSY